MLDIAYSRFKLYARIWGIVLFLIGIIEFGLFLFGSVTSEQPLHSPLTIPFLAAGIIAWYFPRASAFLYYAPVMLVAGIYGTLVSERLGLISIFYILMSFYIVFLYMQMVASEAEEGIEEDALMADLFPKLAAGGGVLALLLSPLAAFAETLPAISTPGLQIGVFALGIGMVALMEVNEQKAFSIGGVALGLIAIVLWAILALL